MLGGGGGERTGEERKERNQMQQPGGQRCNRVGNQNVLIIEGKVSGGGAAQPLGWIVQGRQWVMHAILYNWKLKEHRGQVCLIFKHGPQWFGFES